jgi:hypothetical protein
MSILAPTGLPVINQALEPSSVREGSPATQKAYQRALGFEEMLLEQLSQSLVQTSGLEGESGEATEATEGGSSASAPTSMLSTLLPQALSSSLSANGGLGLATQLMSQLDPQNASTPVAESGGTGS